MSNSLENTSETVEEEQIGGEGQPLPDASALQGGKVKSDVGTSTAKLYLDQTKLELSATPTPTATKLPSDQGQDKIDVKTVGKGDDPVPASTGQGPKFEAKPANTTEYQDQIKPGTKPDGGHKGVSSDVAPATGKLPAGEETTSLSSQSKGLEAVALAYALRGDPKITPNSEAPTSQQQQTTRGAARPTDTPQTPAPVPVSNPQEPSRQPTDQGIATGPAPLLNPNQLDTPGRTGFTPVSAELPGRSGLLPTAVPTESPLRPGLSPLQPVTDQPRQTGQTPNDTPVRPGLTPVTALTDTPLRTGPQPITAPTDSPLRTGPNPLTVPTDSPLRTGPRPLTGPTETPLPQVPTPVPTNVSDPRGRNLTDPAVTYSDRFGRGPRAPELGTVPISLTDKSGQRPGARPLTGPDRDLVIARVPSLPSAKPLVLPTRDNPLPGRLGPTITKSDSPLPTGTNPGRIAPTLKIPDLTRPEPSRLPELKISTAPLVPRPAGIVPPFSPPRPDRTEVKGALPPGPTPLMPGLIRPERPLPPGLVPIPTGLTPRLEPQRETLIGRLPSPLPTLIDLRTGKDQPIKLSTIPLSPMPTLPIGRLIEPPVKPTDRAPTTARPVETTLGLTPLDTRITPGRPTGEGAAASDPFRMLIDKANIKGALTPELTGSVPGERGTTPSKSLITGERSQASDKTSIPGAHDLSQTDPSFAGFKGVSLSFIVRSQHTTSELIASAPRLPISPEVVRTPGSARLPEGSRLTEAARPQLHTDNRSDLPSRRAQGQSPEDPEDKAGGKNLIPLFVWQTLIVDGQERQVLVRKPVKVDRVIPGSELLIGALMASAAIKKSGGATESGGEESNESEEDDNTTDELKNLALKSLRRKTMAVTIGDDLVRIGEDKYDNGMIGWLIADLNLHKVKESWDDGKRIIELRNRQLIELPNANDIEEFFSGPHQRANPKRLVTIITETHIDRDLVDRALSTIVGAAPAANRAPAAAGEAPVAAVSAKNEED